MNSMLPMARIAAQVAAGLGVGHVVKTVIKANTNPQTTFDAIKVWTGSFVLGSMAVDAGMKHVDSQISQVVSWFDKHKPDLSIVPTVPE